MMELPETVEWAIHSSWLLAQAPPGTAVPGRRLAEFHGVPPAYLAKVLKDLVRANILTATSGPRGGYRLARRPDEITLLDVVAALGGATPLFRCQEIRQRGPSPLPGSECRRPCGIAAAMHKADQAWRAELSGTTVADLLARAGIGSVDRAQRWLRTLQDRGAS